MTVQGLLGGISKCEGVPVCVWVRVSMCLCVGVCVGAIPLASPPHPFTTASPSYIQTQLAPGPPAIDYRPLSGPERCLPSPF